MFFNRIYTHLTQIIDFIEMIILRTVIKSSLKLERSSNFNLGTEI